MEAIEVIEIKIGATPGAEIGQCFKEGIELAAKEWRNVRLVYDGKVFFIRPNALVAAIVKRGEDELENNI